MRSSTGSVGLEDFLDVGNDLEILQARQTTRYFPVAAGHTNLARESPSVCTAVLVGLPAEHFERPVPARASLFRRRDQHLALRRPDHRALLAERTHLKDLVHDLVVVSGV